MRVTLLRDPWYETADRRIGGVPELGASFLEGFLVGGAVRCYESLCPDSYHSHQMTAQMVGMRFQNGGLEHRQPLCW